MSSSEGLIGSSVFIVMTDHLESCQLDFENDCVAVALSGAQKSKDIISLKSSYYKAIQSKVDLSEYVY